MQGSVWYNHSDLNTPLLNSAVYWHASCLLALIAIGGLFICRYQLIRIILSYAMTRILRKKLKLQLSIVIDSVSVRTLQCHNMQINFGPKNYLRVEQIHLRILVREFFMLLGHKKLLCLDVDGVTGYLCADLFQLVVQAKTKREKDKIIGRQPRVGDGEEQNGKANIFVMSQYVNGHVGSTKIQLCLYNGAVTIAWSSLSFDVQEIVMNENSSQVMLRVQDLSVNAHPCSDETLSADHQCPASSSQEILASLELWSFECLVKMQLLEPHIVLGVELSSCITSEVCCCKINLAPALLDFLSQNHLKWLKFEQSLLGAKDRHAVRTTYKPSFMISNFLFDYDICVDGAYSSAEIRSQVHVKQLEVAPDTGNQIYKSSKEEYVQLPLSLVTAQISHASLSILDNLRAFDVLKLEGIHIQRGIDIHQCEFIETSIKGFDYELIPIVPEILRKVHSLATICSTYKVQAASYKQSTIPQKSCHNAVKSQCKLSVKLTRGHIYAGLGYNNDVLHGMSGIRLDLQDCHVEHISRGGSKKGCYQKEAKMHVGRVELEADCSTDTSKKWNLALTSIRLDIRHRRQLSESIHEARQQILGKPFSCVKVTHVLHSSNLKADTCTLVRASRLEAATPIIDVSSVALEYENNSKHEDKIAKAHTERVHLDCEAFHIHWSFRDHSVIIDEVFVLKTYSDEIRSTYYPKPAASHKDVEFLSKEQQLSADIRTFKGTIFAMNDPVDKIQYDFRGLAIQLSREVEFDVFKVAFGALSLCRDRDLKIVQVQNAKVDHTIYKKLPASQSLTKTDIVAAEIKLYCRKDIKLLLLIHTMEQMIAYRPRGATSSSYRISKKQKISLQCGRLIVEAMESTNFASSAACSVTDSDGIGFLILDMFCLKLDVSKQKDISDEVSKIFQCMQRSALSMPMRGLLLEKLLSHSVEMDAELSVGACEVYSGSCKSAIVSGTEKCTPLLALRNAKINICMTEFHMKRSALCHDVSPAASSEYNAARPLVAFDASMNIRSWHFTLSDSFAIERIQLSAATIHEALFTKQRYLQNDVDCPSWMYHFSGNLEISCALLIISMPYKQEEQVKYILLRVHDVDVGFQRIAKFFMRTEELAVIIGDDLDRLEDCTSTRMRSNHETTEFYQMLYLPSCVITLVTDWTHDPQVIGAGFKAELSLRILEKSKDVDKVVSLHPKTREEEFLAPAYPQKKKTLLSLHWDLLVPLLDYFFTKSISFDTKPDLLAPEGKAKKLYCTELIWNVSFDELQAVWWDDSTQNAGMLAIARTLNAQGTLYQHLGKFNQATLNQDDHEEKFQVGAIAGWLLREKPKDQEALVSTCSWLPFYSCSYEKFVFEIRSIYYQTASLLESDGISGDAKAPVSDPLQVPITNYHSLFKTFCPGRITKSLLIDEIFHLGHTTFVAPSMSSVIRDVESPGKLRKSISYAKKKGLCGPVHIDSMKLYWSLEIRDRIFYMCIVTMESIHDILSRRVAKLPNEVAQHPQGYDNHPSTPSSASVPASVPHEHSPTSPLKESRLGNDDNSKQSLLDLLKQGKLGVKQHDEAVSETNEESPGNTNTEIANFIDFRQHDIVIQNAQIKLVDDTTRSKILVASKHIRIISGLDSSQSDVITSVAFEQVTVHAVPCDAVNSDKPQWNTCDETQQAPDSINSPALLPLVLEECKLHATYVQTIKSGKICVDAELSFLHLSSDREQFYDLLNVTRHVLLAPPNLSLRDKSRKIQKLGGPIVQHSESSGMPKGAYLGVSNKKFFASMEEELRSHELRTLHKSLRLTPIALKCINFRAIGGRFRLRCDSDKGKNQELIEVRIERITGSHTFYDDQRIKVSFNLQWIEINNLSSSTATSNFDNTPSVMRAKLMVANRFETRDKIPFANEKGMLAIRAESGPVRRLWGQNIRVQDVLEISIFPEIPYVIVIQLAADFYELIYKFLFEHREALRKSSIPATNTATWPIISPTSPGTMNAESTPSSSQGFAKMSALYNSKSPVPSHNTSSIMSGQTLTSRLRGRMSSNSHVSTPSSTSADIGHQFSSHDGVPADGSTDDEEVSAPSEGQELFYFKYVRIGNIHLCISCNGFFVNLNGFEIDLPPYICQGKLSTYKKLLQKFESHLKWHVTKLTASSGLSHFKNKLFKWTPVIHTGGAANSPTAILTGGINAHSVATSPQSYNIFNLGDGRRKSNRDDDDNVRGVELVEQPKDEVAQDQEIEAATYNAQLLFGPYHSPR